MFSFIKSLISPILSLVIIIVGNSYFNTFLSIRINEEGGSNLIAGLIYSAYYGGMMVGSFYMEHIIKRVGHIRAFSIFASITASLILIQGLIDSMLTWFIFRFLVGAAFAGLFIVIESWLLLASTPNKRGKVLAIYMIALYGAQGSGQFLLNFIKIEGIGAFALTAVLSSLSILPVCLMKASYPTLTETERVSPSYLFKKAPLGFIGCVIAGFTLSSFYALGPIYGKMEHMSILQISQIMGFTILGSLLMQTPLGHLSDVFDRRKVILFTAIGLLVTCVAISFSHHYPFPVLLLFFILFGGFSFTLYPLSITYCCDFFSNAGITAIAASCLIVYGMGCIIGPVVASTCMDHLGANGLILYFGVLSISLIGAGFLKFAYRKPHKSTHEEFVPVPETTAQAYQLDPRVEEVKENH